MRSISFAASSTCDCCWSIFAHNCHGRLRQDLTGGNRRFMKVASGFEVGLPATKLLGSVVFGGGGGGAEMFEL